MKHYIIGTGTICFANKFLLIRFENLHFSRLSNKTVYICKGSLDLPIERF